MAEPPHDDLPLHEALRASTAEVARLRTLNHEQQRRLDELDVQLRNAAAHAATWADLDRLKDEFVLTASHDLKSPLAAIRGYSQLLRRRIRNPAPDMALLNQGLSVIDQEVGVIVRLVDDLLDVSRIQLGSFSMDPKPVAMGTIFETMLARLSEEERTQVAVELADAPLAGEWDARRLEQVLVNLVGNALKYGPPGAEVTVRVARQGAAIEVAVHNLGLGIPAAELEAVFTRFHRTEEARRSGRPGTGLGLYICRGIVEAHGGQIWAESAGPGQGATLRFTLPAGSVGTAGDEAQRREEEP
jgi:signal transduction histidine kinase